MRRNTLIITTLLIVVLGACDSGSDSSTDGTATTIAASDTATAGGDPTATFDGEACVYSGPAQFDVGDEETFLLRNNTDTKTGMIVAQIDSGLTIDDINQLGIENVDFVGKTYTRDAAPGGEAVANPVFDESSSWLIMCLVRDPDATDSAPAGDYPSVVFQVDDN